MNHHTHRILFVCMGNICRSPAAEIIFHHLVSAAGLGQQFAIDSAGTIDYQQGNPPDYRMARILKQRGYSVFGTARKITHADLAAHHLILVMDRENHADLLMLDASGEHRHKIHYLTEYCQNTHATEVPDPYTGTERDFEKVADLIEDACRGLLDSLLQNPSPT